MIYLVEQLRWTRSGRVVCPACSAFCAEWELWTRDRGRIISGCTSCVAGEPPRRTGELSRAGGLR